jgi:nicotinamidase/pyrazinamidase
MVMKVQIFFIDCQKDFINDGGALQVPGAPGIVENLKKLNAAAKDDVIRVFTQDYHMDNDVELSSTPNFKTTFPPHCMADTEGVRILNEIMPKQPQYFGYMMRLEDLLKSDFSVNVLEAQDYIFTKNIFSIFDGNPNAAVFVKATAPDIIFVCGVAGDVCVKAVVESLEALNIERFRLAEKEIKIAVVTDAVKSLNESVANTYFGKLEEEGYIQLVNTDYVLKFLEMVEGIGDSL